MRFYVFTHAYMRHILVLDYINYIQCIEVKVQKRSLVFIFVYYTFDGNGPQEKLDIIYL